MPEEHEDEKRALRGAPGSPGLIPGMRNEGITDCLEPVEEISSGFHKQAVKFEACNENWTMNQVLVLQAHGLLRELLKKKKKFRKTVWG